VYRLAEAGIFAAHNSAALKSNQAKKAVLHIGLASTLWAAIDAVPVEHKDTWH